MRGADLPRLFRTLQLSLAVAFSAVLASTFWALHCGRYLFWDGANHLYFTLHQMKSAFDPQSFRYLSVPFTAPAIGFLRVFPNSVSEAGWLFGALRSLPPFASLIACALILRHKKKGKETLFPLLAFALAVLPLLPYPVSLVPETVSVFWPLALLVSFRNPGSRSEAVVIAALAAALAFGHESALVFFAFLSAIALDRARLAAARSPERRGEAAVAGAFALGTLWMVYRVAGPGAVSSETFRRSWGEPWEPHRFYALAIAVLFCAMYRAARGGTRIRPFAFAGFLLASVASIALLYAEFQGFEAKGQLFEAFRARTTAPFFHVLLAAALYLAHRQPASRREPDQLGWTLLGFVVALAWVVAAVHDYARTEIWRRGFEPLKELILSQSGCVRLPTEETERLSEIGTVTWNRPFVSTLPELSVLAGGRRDVSVVAFAGIDKVGCYKARDGKSLIREPVGGYGTFDFSPVMKPVKAKFIP